LAREILWYKKVVEIEKKRGYLFSKKPVLRKTETTWSPSATNYQKGRQPHEKDARVYRKRQQDFYRIGGFEAYVEGMCTV